VVAHIKQYDLHGKETGVIPIDEALLGFVAHPQMVKDYLVAIRNNARQWNANTKTRNEVNRTGKKPHPQKGQGRSRQGCLAAPHYKGGGISFGPRTKVDQHVSINKKERKAAIRSLLVEKIKENQVYVLKGTDFEKPSTKAVANFLKKLDLVDHRILFLGEEVESLFSLSMRNIPKKEYLLVRNMSGYDLALCRTLVVLDDALERFLALLG
jgi:large subunit ribosomal protein L4